jgi:hypothetical protein
MARLFDRASDEYLQLDSAPVTAAPFTFGAWCRTDIDTTTDDYCIMQIQDKDSEQNYWRLTADGADGAGDFRMYAQDGSIAGPASTVIPVVDRWYHVIGIEVASTWRGIYIDGLPRSSNSTDISPAGADSVTIGYEGDSTPGDGWDGAIAEAFLYNTNLRLPEIWMLSCGVPPSQIRPQNLVAYWPLFGTDRDMGKSRFHMTPYNTPSWADHPPKVLAWYEKYQNRAVSAPHTVQEKVW